jgi:hypothetical protein
MLDIVQGLLAGIYLAGGLGLPNRLQELAYGRPRAEVKGLD